MTRSQWDALAHLLHESMAPLLTGHKDDRFKTCQ